jgi:hypothetical protein
MNTTPSAKDSNLNSKASVTRPEPSGVDSSLQQKVMRQIHDLGDSLERAGNRIEKKGWESVGQAVYKLGNSIEHLLEKPVGGTTKAYRDQAYDEKTKNSSDPKASAIKVTGNDSQAV